MQETLQCLWKVRLQTKLINKFQREKNWKKKFKTQRSAMRISKKLKTNSNVDIQCIHQFIENKQIKNINTQKKMKKQTGARNQRSMEKRKASNHKRFFLPSAVTVLFYQIKWRISFVISWENREHFDAKFNDFDTKTHAREKWSQNNENALKIGFGQIFNSEII